MLVRNEQITKTMSTTMSIELDVPWFILADGMGGLIAQGISLVKWRSQAWVGLGLILRSIQSMKCGMVRPLPRNWNQKRFTSLVRMELEAWELLWKSLLLIIRLSYAHIGGFAYRLDSRRRIPSVDEWSFLLMNCLAGQLTLWRGRSLPAKKYYHPVIGKRWTAPIWDSYPWVRWRPCSIVMAWTTRQWDSWYCNQWYSFSR